MSIALQLLGRMHPMVLHLPIGLLFGLAALELWSGWRSRRAAPREVSLVLATLAAFFSVWSAASGFALSYEPGYGSDEVALHQALGLAVMAGSVLLAVFRATFSSAIPYLVALTLTVVILVPAGHLGAGLTHGDGFLFEPLQRALRPAPAPTAATAPAPAPGAASAPGAPRYVQEIAPLLAARCGECHGPERARGRLALHEPALIRKGGKGGPILAEIPAESELLRRILLPADDDDHMPPEDAQQLSAEEVALLRAWIEAGAPFGDEASQLEPGATATVALKSNSTIVPTDLALQIDPAPPEALADLRSELVHVAAIFPGSNELVVDFAAASTLPESRILALLEPLKKQIVDLSLVRTTVTDRTVAALAVFENLRRLDLRGTAVSGAPFPPPGGLKRLEALVLAQTRVGDEAVEGLLAMPSLRRLYVWNSAITVDGVARLRSAGERLTVDDGRTADQNALETEPDLQFSGDAPVEGVASGATATAGSGSANPLQPVNVACPVTGQTIDPNFAIVIEGRVIGFCCANCVARYWSDPEKYGTIATSNP